MDFRNGLSVAYAIAYINFEKEEDAVKAILEMHGYNYNGHHLLIEYYNRQQ
jgi:RNA recognition motif-containing protein